MHLNISTKILVFHVVEIHFEDLDYPLQLPRPIKLISTRFNKKKPIQHTVKRSFNEPI